VRPSREPEASPGASLGAPLSTEHATVLARLALDNLAREYPNHPQLLLASAGDLAPPRAVHPSFFGCFDWHSAVHTHWLLVRLLRTYPDLPVRAAAAAALTSSLTPGNTRVEAAYLERRRSFERPYGLAWLLLLHAETAACALPDARGWSSALEPLATAARANVLQWLAALRYPVRSGTHNQTAFALTLLFDAAASLGDAELAQSVRAAALAHYRGDSNAPLQQEPSGEDFLSPSLMEADLMRRVLGASDFATWLGRFLPALPERDVSGWLDCGEVADERDGKLVHLHGLNLSRAWNLANLAAALPPEDRRRAALAAAARRHADAGVRAALAATDYASTHWLPTFVVYLLTRPERS
jgi:hypothetical protein